MKKRAVRFMDYPENGVTVALLGEKESSTHCDAYRLIEELLEESKTGLTFLNWNGDLGMKDYYKAISKCNKFYDAYNQEIGREVAEEKCREKYNTAINKRLIKFINSIYKLEAMLETELIARGAMDLCDFCDEESCDCEDCR